MKTFGTLSMLSTIDLRDLINFSSANLQECIYLLGNNDTGGIMDITNYCILVANYYVHIHTCINIMIKLNYMATREV